MALFLLSLQIRALAQSSTVTIRIEPRTNLAVVQSLVAECGNIILDSLKNSSEPVVVACIGNKDCWITEQGLQNVVRQRGVVAFADSVKRGSEPATADASPKLRIEAYPVLLVSYFEAGSSLLERSAHVSITYRAVNQSTGQIEAARCHRKWVRANNGSESI